MKMFIFGVVFGIIVNTVGLAGLGRIIDAGLGKVQTISKEAAEVK